MNKPKVYPALNKFAEKNTSHNNGAIVEIYDVPNKKILYRKEINGEHEAVKE